MTERELHTAVAQGLRADAAAYAAECRDENGEPLDYDRGWIAALDWAAAKVDPKPEPDRGEGVPSMPYVDGRRFYCHCGVGVFTHYPAVDIFVCNGCSEEYAAS